MFKLPALAVFVFAAALSAQTMPAGHPSDLKNANGNVIGTVTVTSAPHGVLLRVQAKDLTPGWHGMHFHEKGDCSDAAFKSAGGHVHAETPVVHGFLNSDANDSGDLPNLFVAADGTAEVELYSTLVSLHGGEGRPALLDADGSALVIHADPDDYKSQPIGGAGARVACAVIR
ncbi:MAG: superoxide dismutase family protein [Acidobacteriaceae bacterium]